MPQKPPQDVEDDDIDFEALRWEAQERKLQGLRSEILDEVRVYTAAGGVVVSAGNTGNPAPYPPPLLHASHLTRAIVCRQSRVHGGG